MQPTGYQVYQQNAVQTAPPEKLVLMLYEGALRFLGKAQKALAAKDLQNVNNNLLRVQEIINELMVNVNKDAGDLAEKLVLLYDYIYRRLVEANVRKEQKIMQEVEEMLKELRGAWQEAITKTPNNARAEAEQKVVSR